MDNLYSELKKYNNCDIYPYHMPGHKRNMNTMPMAEAYAIDLTEVEGSDNLYHAEGILKDAMQRAANLYHAEETHFLVNGSTGGILSAISACVKQGGHILMARNCHRSAYNAVMLKNLRSTYLYPEYIKDWQVMGGITPEAVRIALEANPEIEAVFITSPTYEGLVSDIKQLAEEVHKYDIPLIVDEAHGAHFGLNEVLPDSAVTEGADLVIQSLHKTLPAFTQTALLHVNGNRVDREKIRMYLSLYQTSSPSYVLMAGIDQCIALLEEKRTTLFAQFYQNRQQFFDKIKELKHIRILDKSILQDIGGHASFHAKNPYGTIAMDDCKLVISAQGTNYNGQKLYEILLHQYGLQMEMAASTYVLAILTVMDTREGFDRLAKALLAIDKEVHAMTEDNHQSTLEKEKIQIDTNILYSCGKPFFTIGEAVEKDWENCRLMMCENRVAADYICLYPPGIPLIVPGEQFTACLIRQIEAYQKEGLCLLGVEKNQNTVKVVK